MLELCSRIQDSNFEITFLYGSHTILKSFFEISTPLYVARAYKVQNTPERLKARAKRVISAKGYSIPPILFYYIGYYFLYKPKKILYIYLKPIGHSGSTLDTLVTTIFVLSYSTCCSSYSIKPKRRKISKISLITILLDVVVVANPMRDFNSL